MKTIIITMAIIAATGLNSCTGQSEEEKDISTTIINFSKEGDKNNVKKLAAYLDENYRIVLNRQFGSKVVNTISKTDYLSKIESKEWGGDTRTVTINKIVLNQDSNTAIAIVTFKGEKSTFYSTITLIKGENDDWKLISDIPNIK